MGMGAGGQLAYGLYLGNEDDYPEREWARPVFELLEDFDDDDEFVLKVIGAPEDASYEQKREYLGGSPFTIARMGYYDYSQLVLCPPGSFINHYSWDVSPVDLAALVAREEQFEAQMNTAVAMLGIDLPPEVTFQWFLGADYG